MPKHKEIVNIQNCNTDNMIHFHIEEYRIFSIERQSLIIKNEELTKKVEDLYKELTQQQKEIICKNIPELEEKIKNLNIQNDERAKEISELINKNIEICTENKQLKEGNKQLKDENVRLKLHIEELEKIVEKQQHLIVSQQTDIIQLKTTVKDLQEYKDRNIFLNQIHNVYCYFRRGILYDKLEEYKDELNQDFIKYVKEFVDFAIPNYSDTNREKIWLCATSPKNKNIMYKENALKLLKLIGIDPVEFCSIKEINILRDYEIHDENIENQIDLLISSTTNGKLLQTLKKIRILC